MLRVYRQDAEIALAFKVRELVGGQEVYVTKPLVESGEERTKPTITVRSPWFAGVSILLHMDEARILSADSNKAVMMRPGTYSVEIVAISNDRKRTWTGQFVVGAERRNTRWVN